MLDRRNNVAASGPTSAREHVYRHRVVASVLLSVIMLVYVPFYWAQSSPALVMSVVSTYGSDAVVWSVYARRIVTSAVMVVVVGILTAWALNWRASSGIAVSLALLAVVMATPCFVPAYDGPSGIDHIGHMFVAEYLRVYGGAAVVAVAYPLAMVVAHIRNKWA